jgi:hypothetical protein
VHVMFSLSSAHIFRIYGRYLMLVDAQKTGF